MIKMLIFVWDALVSNLDRLFGCEHPSSLLNLFAVLKLHIDISVLYGTEYFLYIMLLYKIEFSIIRASCMTSNFGQHNIT